MNQQNITGINKGYNEPRAAFDGAKKAFLNAKLSFAQLTTVQESVEQKYHELVLARGNDELCVVLDHQLNQLQREWDSVYAQYMAQHRTFINLMNRHISGLSDSLKATAKQILPSAMSDQHSVS